MVQTVNWRDTLCPSFLYGLLHALTSCMQSTCIFLSNNHMIIVSMCWESIPAGGRETSASLSGVISYLFLLLCLDIKSFMKVEQKQKPSLSVLTPLLLSFWQRIKELVSSTAVGVWIHLNLSRSARHAFYFYFSPTLFILSFFSFSCQSFCHPFLSIFKLLLLFLFFFFFFCFEWE